MGLDDLVRPTWVCSRLMCLKLIVRYEQFKDAAYFEGDHRMSGQDRLQWRKWQGLYQRIGSLVDLQELSLQLVFSITEDRQRTFPGFLQLGNGNAARPGYLEEMGDLRQLRVLKEPFTMDLPETAALFGKNEARWIVEKLAKVEGDPAHAIKDDKPAVYQECPSLAWIKTQRPAMQLY